MARQTAVLISGAPLVNAAALEMVLREAHTYFTEYGEQPPPLPDNVLNFTPCGVLITLWEGDNRERIGRIEISKPDGRIVFDKAWSLDGRAVVDENSLVDRGDGTAPMLFGDQADTPIPLRVGGATNGPIPPRGGRVFNVSVEENLSLTDSVDAVVVPARPVRTGDVNVQLEGVSANAITGNLSITEENDRVSAVGTVIADIWNIDGPDAIFRIDQAQNELIAVRDFLVGLRAAQSSDLIGHNNPPDRIDPPDVDIEALDAAIQALKVLRPLLAQPQPDFEVVKLIWNVLIAALRGLVKVAAWLGRLSKAAFTAILNSAFGQAFQTAAGGVLGTAAATALLATMAGIGPEALPKVIEFLKAVAAATGHPF